MAITEEQAYAALRMEVPSRQPEAADPAPAAGENVQELTDPAGAEQTENKPTSDESAGMAEGNASPEEGEATESEEQREDNDAAQVNGGEKSGMSRAERAEQARLRRQRETDQAISAAVEQAIAKEREKNAAQLKRIFAQAGMTDRYNGGKQITSLEEFEAWQAKAAAERLSRQLKDGSLTPETFQQAVESTPAVQEAREIVERLKAEEEESKKARSREQFEKQVAYELGEIHKLDPSVNSLEDVMNLPTGNEFASLVRERGLSYLDAFKLANMERIMQARSMAAAEGTARQQHSKDHLRSVVGTGGTAVDVPADVIRLYRTLNPEMTLDQIRADYARRTK